MSRAEEISQYTRSKLAYLSSLPENHRKAAMAELRHGIGKEPGDMPQLWGILCEGMPDKWMREDGIVSFEERAVYDAVTLYALHMQGKDSTADMDTRERRIGNAIALLGSDNDEKERIRKRFLILFSRPDLEGLAYYLRGMIAMLRKENIGFDYAALAADFYRYQFPESAVNVRLSWGQDYYKTLDLSHKEEVTENEQHNEQ